MRTDRLIVEDGHRALARKRSGQHVLLNARMQSDFGVREWIVVSDSEEGAQLHMRASRKAARIEGGPQVGRLFDGDGEL